jgi:TPP-dependent indolepyruvate ferredoxin oxidoreductase alpha subunit
MPSVPSNAVAPLRRIAARGRPFEDPGCAGCRHLALLRALRRAGLVIDGGLGCESLADADRDAPPGRVARVAGAAEAIARADALLGRSRGVALLAVVDRDPPRAEAVSSALAAAGARVTELPSDASAADAERLVANALANGPAVLVALAPCARAAPARPPLTVDPARCNRCGSCLSLGCVAIADPGGEAVEIDAALCTGCALCAPLCRAGAVGR